MKSIGFIGVGELALYTIRGIRRGGFNGKIYLGPRNREKVDYLVRHHNCEALPDNQTVASASDYVFIATRPADCLTAIEGIEFSTEQILVSVVAGMEVRRLQDVIGNQTKIVRAMPVSSAEAGESPTLIYPPNPFVEEIFNYCGQSLSVEDEAVYEQGSVLACVYCWFYSLFETLIQSTQGPRLPPELSSKLVMGMAKGAAALALEKSEFTPGQIAEQIATDGTFSKMGLDLLRQEQAFEPWHHACKLLEEKLAAAE